MALSDRILKIQEVCLCLSRKWWRPTLTWTAVIAVILNAFVIPLWNKEAASLSELAILFGALAPFFITREVGKYLGNNKNEEEV